MTSDKVQFFKEPLPNKGMFGRGKKKEEPESGLRYADHTVEPARGSPGEMLHSFDTDRGPLEMAETAMVLATKDGNITVPYHQIDAWDDVGRKFRVWWSADTQHYTMSCEPKMPPASLSGRLREIIHQNTFGV